MRKRIGVTASVLTLRSGVEGIFAGDDYTSAILQAGAMPVVLPMMTEEDEIQTLADQLDGLLLTGGVDLDPSYFGEEPIPQLGEVSPVRDEMEWKLTRAFLQLDKPIFAICRGMQVLNVAAGGSLYQDLAVQKRKVLQHMQKSPRWHASHEVMIEEGTKLASIFRKKQIRVNSFHHQSIKDAAPGFVVSGTAPDGVIEAVESPAHRYVVGVQWHPENMWRRHPIFYQLFKTFVDHC
ncbi:gamma-glutamyl-gamma-aminobutyrate hydrolase family protein [Effusibacillus lacus]|uniref:Peptidase C26 n=1 Tax=Effusibacillus lacus TaxID=1348429 RepID=A0A292YK96_9BACL|nr:gamma-glutamyl-gamma-aminobutyrate hydrolase family protein [Effusibacillus lacus]TCS74348.1 putative glutamine amidotransferase [Effusibacillus lacus]GAX88804.1 peptidase C26 [Effusibacillus lacus]